MEFGKEAGFAPNNFISRDPLKDYDDEVAERHDENLQLITIIILIVTISGIREPIILSW